MHKPAHILAVNIKFDDYRKEEKETQARHCWMPVVRITQ